jgi:dihydroneopterin aldolase
MNNIEFVQKLNDIATNYKTLYVLGVFGWPMNSSMKTRAMNEQSYNRSATRKSKINAATASTFGFDCVNLLKAVLWGWDGNKNRAYGGATYESNGVPDIDANVFFTKCKNASDDFSKIEVGEAVWMKGHIGVYVGDGLAVECTPRWKDGVQITAVHNIGKKAGYNGRNWTKHGKIPYIEYVPETKPVEAKKTVAEIAQEVIDGKWGNGAARKSALKKAGYDYGEVQAKVNELLAKKSGLKSIDVIAQEVLDGKWHNGAARKSALKKAGYDYDEVQKKVNELIAKKNTEKSITAVAKEVIAGKWGNGKDRERALKKAGYDYKAVQKKVNELL